MPDTPDRYTPASPDRAAADAARTARENLVADARRLGQAQALTRSAPDPLPPQRNLSEMVPPGVDPHEYISSMVRRADGASTPHSQRALAPNAPLPVAPRSAYGDCTTPGGFRCSFAHLKAGGRFAYMSMEVEAEQGVPLGLLERAQNGGYRVPGQREQAAREDLQRQDELEAQQQREAELPALRASGEAPDAEAAGPTAAFAGFA